MVGEIDVAIADQTATFLFRGNSILIQFANLGSAMASRNIAVAGPKLVAQLLSFSGVELKLRIGRLLPTVELFPRPNFLTRWLSPSVRQLAQIAAN